MRFRSTFSLRIVFLLATLVAAARSQTLLWNFNTSYIVSAGAAFSSNKLLVGGRNCKLYALDASNSGKLLWNYTLPTYQPLKRLSQQTCAIGSAPVVDLNSVSNVYLHSSDGYLYALNTSSPTTTPSLRWRFPNGVVTTITPPTSPVLSSDGSVVYSTSVGGYMFAVNSSTGQQVWNISVATAVSTTPVISTGTQILGEPILFFGTGHGYLFAARAASGSQAWSYYVGSSTDSISGAPILGADSGTPVVFFGCNDKNVYALSASSGLLRWVYNTTAPVLSSPTFDPANADGPALCVFPL
jgi:outer membrane protein assembly factor BamB